MPREVHVSSGMKSFVSGFLKQETLDPVELTASGLVGDGQADRKHHGGPDKAICVYSLESYQRFGDLGFPSMGPGGFGENFTVSGQDEQSVCIGDRFQIGPEVVVEVSQPRAPCFKLAQIHSRKKFALECQQSGLTGWYLRVIEGGAVQVNQALVLVARPNPSLSILKVNSAAYDKEPSDELLEALAACPQLSSDWREKFRKRLAKVELDSKPRLYGSSD
jgi:MOSC domain-containing protein YiiM